MSNNKNISNENKSATRKDKMREYRARYWDNFHKTRKRIYGTVSSEYYKAVKERAEQTGNSVWTQIIKESEAYANNTPMMPQDYIERMDEIIMLLRRAGTNINQMAHVMNREGVIDMKAHNEYMDAFKQEIDALRKRID